MQKWLSSIFVSYENMVGLSLFDDDTLQHKISQILHMCFFFFTLECQDLRVVANPELVPLPPWLSTWQPSVAPPDVHCWQHLEDPAAPDVSAGWRRGAAQEAQRISTQERQEEKERWQKVQKEQMEEAGLKIPQTLKKKDWELFFDLVLVIHITDMWVICFGKLLGCLTMVVVVL